MHLGDYTSIYCKPKSSFSSDFVISADIVVQKMKLSKYTLQRSKENVGSCPGIYARYGCIGVNIVTNRNI